MRTDPAKPLLAWWPLAVVAVGLLASTAWLVVERRAVYGDERSHLEIAASIADAWRGAPSTVQGLRSVYEGDGRYPPLAYLALLGAGDLVGDPLLGGRIVSGIAASCALGLLAWAVAATTGRRRDGVFSALLVAATPMFQEAARFAMLEAQLLFWLAVVLAAWIASMRATTERARNAAWLLATAGTVAGLLVKFNFGLYAAPILALAAVEELTRARAAGRAGPAIARIACAAAAVALCAGPWYVLNASSSSAALAGRDALVEVGHLVLARTPGEMLASIVHVARVAHALPVAIAGILLLVLGMFVALRRGADPVVRVVATACIASIVLLSIALPWIGLGTQVRWHVQYWFFAVLAGIALPSCTGRFGRHAATATRVLLLAPACVQIAAYLGLGVPNASAPWIASERSLRLGAPSGQSTGVEEIAALVDAWFPLRGPGEPPVRITFLVQERRGAHSDSLLWELERIGRDDVVVERPAFFDRPVDLDLLFLADAVVVGSTEPLRSDPEIARWQKIEDRLDALAPPDAAAPTVVGGRHVALALRPIDGAWRSCSTIARALAAARADESRPEGVLILDLQARLWRFRVRCPDSGVAEPSTASIRERIAVLGPSMTGPTRALLDDLLRRLEAVGDDELSTRADHPERPESSPRNDE
jgi:4-amino-4-deoxy-L-arabinose transferase-like glycosyltransferase